ncbi:MAG: hypothetical protein RMI34_04560 [Chloroherpetonaceae bacterium]|nr:hypothetical protein [Chloroherpetonaceae bacterium]MCS7212416.1 hypothetical protein [Chloroherpetonaceae bacterium]MDW8019329.1 hypothetical protein [Chloroherpetonaceae bacterium]MDW8465479.1 hypothetical protein [Chloroherpetonaceae bacterium]
MNEKDWRMQDTRTTVAPTAVHLAVAWDWEYDYDFIRILEQAAQRHQARLLTICAYNLDEVLAALRASRLQIGVLLDRASDTNELFMPLQPLAQRHGTRIINPFEISQRTMDKATMHYLLIQAGVNVPHTVILPPFEVERKLNTALIEAIAQLKMPFVLKPANGGGGEGVAKSVYSPFDASAWRQIIPWDKYLAQEKIYPKYLYGWRCWFRAYYLFGEVEIAWWDDERHLYRSLSDSDKLRIPFEAMCDAMQRIARVSQMDFFSSELALSVDDRLVAVDYVNDPIDLRPKSRHFDGLPNTLVERIADSLIQFAQRHCVHAFASTPVSLSLP